MKAIVVYDSLYGNTKKVAEAIASFCGKNTKVFHVAKNSHTFDGVELLIVGSPTHGGRPSPAIREFLNTIPDNSLKGVRIVSFDTGITPEGKGFFLRMIIHMFGYAARHITKMLVEKGGKEAAKPMTFFVVEKEGPIKQGELDKIPHWLHGLHI